MRTSIIRMLVGAALAAGLATGGAQADEPTKVGFIYVGPVGDFGWSHQHDQGRQALEKAFGDKVKTSFVESVQEGADAERVVRQFAAGGYDLVFTTSFGFMNPTLKVAQQFPKVKFEHATGYKRSANVATYAARFYEGRYVIGVIAGLTTKSKVVGYVASFPIPEVVSGINAFARGLHSVNPEAQVKVIWVNSWYDPGKEREAAETLIAQGADVLSQHTDSPAPVQVAEEKGIFAFGQASDMSRFGPHAQLTAIVDNWNEYYIDRVKAVMDGTWKAEDTWGGLAAGMVHLAPYNAALPADVVEKAEAVRKAIVDGSLHPFAGPLKNQAGQEIVPAGQVLADDKILSMDWYIEGVQGQLPK
ncbi:BMP family ABC transporter substrate-binding protein [Rhodospirillum rubrum]|uniref:Basic membrane lipoprotein n=1 Tax=Rhodospirillum rubrum (strain ATCC 11170 / ATH 1.1.1 / DSM 467 / LMG 4362 / NCIMB 8255 / S1) TaxID=269796 RepID=Q2RT43_RHORT|nr:BMP family ABC transporter substrate-binding protein [Rhodospirillum rubrum]ABC22702.1 Basic membrane lipoprotein [Rhodospirillum rubrum ATCC 11170]MBK5954300.1 BMP family ABC transporter substrate-binding protein [Rhodospirillum rubrum]HAQ00894.1 BMP family ABC transporter substrate-binding protein [Rhodospirillum rubrum]HCF16511.1 BMP family ABC transporter substrate-binding protein [Rhodospirillum rubrum]